jgi:transcriptional regulator with XRE-family HTH domain
MVDAREQGRNFAELRKRRGFTQESLADAAHISRSSVAKWETGNWRDARYQGLHKAAIALGMTVDELMAAVEEREPLSPDNPEDLLARFQAAQPHRLIIRTDFVAHAGTPVAPPEYHWLPRGGAAPVNIEAIKVRGTCLEPDIQENDIIIVDKTADVNVGDTVAYVYQDELHLGKLRRMDGELYIENAHGRIKLDDCPQVARVIQIERKLK